MKSGDLIPILYEDDHLIAISKPSRVATVPDRITSHGWSVMGLVEEKYKPKGIVPYPLHRLDKDTTGVLLFGKYPRDREKLEDILGAPETVKTYIALVKGRPFGKAIRADLKARHSDEMIKAETQFTVLKSVPFQDVFLSYVEAKIKTGRKHQIRQHFASIHCPIVNDREYGDTKFNTKFNWIFHLGRHFLHARSVEFVHPFTGEKIKIVAPFTKDLGSVIKRTLGKANALD
jgi:tRNA pseudouridine65 synthase